MSQVSSVSKDLFLLNSIQDFQDYSLRLVAHSSRHVAILSDDLDELMWGTPEFISLISSFARSNRNAQVQILVKNTKILVEKNHPFLKLQQRLPSKILLRKLTVLPQNTDMGFMLCDTDKLLYKNDDAHYKGFANLNAAAETKRLREIFDYLWQYGEVEPDLQILYI